MKQFTKQQISDTFRRLPSEVQDAILSPETGGLLADLMRTAQLNEGQYRDLGTATTCTLVGLVTPEELRDYIKKELGVDVKIGDTLFRDISARILTVTHRKFTTPNAPTQKNTETESTGSDWLTEIIRKDPVVEKRFRALPTRVQEVITSTSVVEALKRAVENTLIDPTKKEDLVSEVLSVMVGIRKITELEARLTTGLGMLPGQAKDLIQTLEIQVFQAVRIAILKTLERSPTSTPEEQKPITPQPTKNAATPVRTTPPVDPYREQV